MMVLKVALWAIFLFIFTYVAVDTITNSIDRYKYANEARRQAAKIREEIRKQNEKTFSELKEKLQDSSGRQ